jgi:hypothetical protein
MPPLAKREIAQVVGIGLVVLATSSIPYLLGYLSAAPGMEFCGFVVDLDDSYSHLAKMQQGVWSGWRYRILFTPEEHLGAYLNTFYLGLGKLSSLLGLSLMPTYQLARLACGLSLLIMAYIFLSFFLEGRDARLVAYLLISFSSGLGWLILLSGSSTLAGVSPIDFWLMDAYTFFTIFTFPHASAAVTFLLLFFILALRYFEAFQLRALLLGSLTLLGLCIIHPFTALLVDSVLVTYWVLLLLNRKRVPGREAPAILIWVLTPIPLIAYYYQAFVSDAVFQSWSAQNVLPSPPLPHLLLGYGIIFLLAVGGIAYAIRQRNERSLLLVAWVISAMVLLYLPFKLQRRMVEGLHVPLCVVATIGLFEYLLPVAMNSNWLNRFARWRGYTSHGLRRLLLYSVIIATFPSNLYLVTASSASVLHDDPTRHYLSEEVEAVDWLKNNTERTDTVLASYKIGRFIPAHAGNRVFMGHFIETVEVEYKKRLAVSFFRDSATDDFRRDLLTEYGISYVFHGPTERQIGGFDPSRALYLTPVYHDSSVAIYRANR